MNTLRRGPWIQYRTEITLVAATAFAVIAGTVYVNTQPKHVIDVPRVQEPSKTNGLNDESFKKLERRITKSIDEGYKLAEQSHDAA